MRRMASVVVAFAWLVAASAQAPPQISSFAGTFKAEFHKHTWLVLTLIDNGNGLTGTIMHSVQLSADDEGDITSVGDEMSTDTVSSTELRGDTLHIFTKDEEGNEDQYLLSLSGPDSAELKSVDTDGTSGPKPFKLKREAGASDKPAPK